MSASQDRERADRTKIDKAKLDAIFGDVLPDITSDERSPDSSAGTPDDWLRSQVPPHHG